MKPATVHIRMQIPDRRSWYIVARIKTDGKTDDQLVTETKQLHPEATAVEISRIYREPQQT